MKRNGTISDLLSLTVFALFALCVLAVLLAGARICRSQTVDAEARHDTRTAAQYFATRVRQADHVTVTPFGSGQALTLHSRIDGENYLTRVYCHDGAIRELFCAETAALAPEDGTPLWAASRLGLSLQNRLLTVQLDSQTLFLHIPAGEEALP